MCSYHFLPEGQKLKRFLINDIINIYNVTTRYRERGPLIPYVEQTVDWYRLFMETNFENIKILSSVIQQSTVRIHPTYTPT